jgi:hypothetical protein
MSSKKKIYYTKNDKKCRKLLSIIESKGLLADFDLIDIVQDGKVISNLPEDLTHIPSILVPDMKTIFYDENAYSYISAISSMNQPTNNINNKITSVSCDTYTGYKGMNNAETKSISDSYTFIENNKNIDKICFNTIDRFDEEIININEKSLIDMENQQQILNKMFKIRNSQDNVVFDKDNNMTEKLITDRDISIRATPKIKTTNQIGSNLLNNRMQNYNFRKP